MGWGVEGGIECGGGDGKVSQGRMTCGWWRSRAEGRVTCKKWGWGYDVGSCE